LLVGTRNGNNTSYNYAVEITKSGEIDHIVKYIYEIPAISFPFYFIGIPKLSE